MQFLYEVLGNILGGIKPSIYVACLLLAYASSGLRFLYTVVNRDPLSRATPVHFSPAVFWQENWPRILFNILFIALILIVPQQFLGAELNNVVAIGAGLTSDLIAKQAFPPENRRSVDPNGVEQAKKDSQGDIQ
jgi:hypothetical protein